MAEAGDPMSPSSVQAPPFQPALSMSYCWLQVGVAPRLLTHQVQEALEETLQPQQLARNARPCQLQPQLLLAVVEEGQRWLVRVVLQREARLMAWGILAVGVDFLVTEVMDIPAARPKRQLEATRSSTAGLEA